MYILKVQIKPLLLGLSTAIKQGTLNLISSVSSQDTKYQKGEWHTRGRTVLHCSGSFCFWHRKLQLIRVMQRVQLYPSLYWKRLGAHAFTQMPIFSESSCTYVELLGPLLLDEKIAAASLLMWNSMTVEKCFHCGRNSGEQFTSLSFLSL